MADIQQYETWDKLEAAGGVFLSRPIDTLA